MAIHVSVTERVVNTVKPLLFGDNVDWRGDGFGICHEETGKLDERIVEAFAECGVTSLRYPGGTNSSYFHWAETLGEDRKPQIDAFSTYWPTRTEKQGALIRPNFGFEEFLELCDRTGMQPSIILNVGNGTPREAADWILYCLRHGVKLSAIDVGNEENFQHEQVPGMHIAKLPEEYIAFFEEMYALLQAELPEKELKALPLGAIGLPPEHPLCVIKDWDQKVITALADKIHYFDVHIGYTPYDSRWATPEDLARCYMASAQWIEGMLRTVKEEICRYAGEYADRIDVHITEFGSVGMTRFDKSLAGAVFQADLLNMMMKEPKLTAANHLPIVNSPGAANIVAFVKDHPVYPAVHDESRMVIWKNAISYVYDWYTKLSGQQVLETSVGAEVFSAGAVGLVPPIDNVPLGDAAAFLDEKNVLTLMLIQRDTRGEQTFVVELPAECDVLSVQRLHHEDCLTFNHWEKTDAIQPRELDGSEMTLEGKKMSMTCPAVSLTCIRLKKKSR